MRLEFAEALFVHELKDLLSAERGSRGSVRSPTAKSLPNSAQPLSNWD